MRAIVKPDYESLLVYQTCINSISDRDLRSRLDNVSNDIHNAAKDYEQKAIAKQLYTIIANNSDNDELALGTVTKKELKDVYSVHMVGKTKPAREFYDELLSQAPLGRCPFCGIGYASTLDHFLPKTKYPQLSVLPINLVPSCKDCNTGKNNVIPASAKKQSLHPYFDHQNFIDEQWLFAEVTQTTPAMISFFVKVPDHWDDVSKGRVKSHFVDFKLDFRYAIEAGNELAGIKDMLNNYKEQHGSNALVELLTLKSESHAKQHANSWQTAFYQALASNNWDHYTV
jgi:hypothetical protein